MHVGQTLWLETNHFLLLGQTHELETIPPHAVGQAHRLVTKPCPTCESYLWDSNKSSSYLWVKPTG